MGILGWFTPHQPQRDKTPAIVLPLVDEILKLARDQDYIPEGEMPLIPELKNHANEVVTFVRTHIHNDMKTKGLRVEEMEGVFGFVFMRAFDAAYQWHMSLDGRIDTAFPAGNIYNEPLWLKMPDRLQTMLRPLPAPKLLYHTTVLWLRQYQDDLLKQGIDVWVPLTTALSLTFAITVSMALKLFGYRE